MLRSQSKRLSQTESPDKRSSWRIKLVVGVFLLLLAIVISVSLYVVFNKDDNSEDMSQAQQDFQDQNEILHLGAFQICNWEQIVVSDTVLVGDQPITFKSTIVEGEECSTGDVATLVMGEDGVYGSIGDVRVTAQSSTTSLFEPQGMSDGELPTYHESEKTRVREKQWKHDQAKIMSAQGPQEEGGRRQLLNPGQIDIHLHLDLDQHMTDTMGDYGAAQYAVELLAIVNRDVYYSLGFNLKVVSINLRDSYVTQSSSTSAYLDVIQAEGRPNNVNLVHSLTTRSLGGGIAYMGGLYSSTYCYGVSGSLKGYFGKWDRIVVAHELGHNFGAYHTHDMTPQVDNCGNQCPADPSGGTIMSYCHTCPGGLLNVDFLLHQEVKDDIMEAYHSRKTYLADRQHCTDISVEFPDVGVPFVLKASGECLSMAGTNPSLCELDSAWTRDSDSNSFRLRSEPDSHSCWTADCPSASLVLRPCGTGDAQKFSFVNGALRSVACSRNVAASNGLLSLEGTAISQWCNLGAMTATDAPTQATYCEDNNNGARDPWNDDCAWYNENPSGCGKYDDSDFRSNEMCCGCGGGVQPQSTTDSPTPEPTRGSSEPTTSTARPTTTTATSTTARPTTTTAQPTSTTARPTTTTTAQPTSTTARPTTTTTAQPTSTTAEPTVRSTSSTLEPTVRPWYWYCCTGFYESWCFDGTNNCNFYCGQIPRYSCSNPDGDSDDDEGGED